MSSSLGRPAGLLQPCLDLLHQDSERLTECFCIEKDSGEEVAASQGQQRSHLSRTFLMFCVLRLKDL